MVAESSSSTAGQQNAEGPLPKVFVGNLAFKTTEEDLAKAFAVHGEVVSANIITRGPRSLGYGFVEFKTLETAQVAVEKMDKQSLDGRDINVELANPRAEDTDKPSSRRPVVARRGRGGFRGRGRGGFRGRGGRGRFRSGPDTRVPSETMLYIANLPYEVDDQALSDIFKDLSVEVKSAHVVRKASNDRSKGFGFVEVCSKEQQQSAVEALDGKEVGGRPLIVKVALTENGRGDNGGKDNSALSSASENATEAEKATS